MKIKVQPKPDTLAFLIGEWETKTTDNIEKAIVDILAVLELNENWDNILQFGYIRIKLYEIASELGLSFNELKTKAKWRAYTLKQLMTWS